MCTFPSYSAFCADDYDISFRSSNSIFQIPYRDFAKLLGISFDQNLTWTIHIKILRTECTRSIKMIEYISHPQMAVIENSYSTQISSLRLALGAFRTSPKSSLYAEVADSPLSLLPQTDTNL